MLIYQECKANAHIISGQRVLTTVLLSMMCSADFLFTLPEHPDDHLYSVIFMINLNSSYSCKQVCFHSNYHFDSPVYIDFFNVCMIFICCFDSLDRNLHVVTVLNKSAHLREWHMCFCEVIQTCSLLKFRSCVLWELGHAMCCHSKQSVVTQPLSGCIHGVAPISLTFTPLHTCQSAVQSGHIVCCVLFGKFKKNQCILLLESDFQMLNALTSTYFHAY